MIRSSTCAIFIAFDDAYWLYARTCLNSLRENYPGHPQIFVVYEGTNADTIEYLHRIPELRLLVPKDLVDPGLVNLGVVNNKGVYYKYTAWGSIFSQFEKVLYLDVDTLVLKPLDDLFEMDTVCAVPNHEPSREVRVFHPNVLHDPLLLELLDKDRLSHLSHMDEMCNAGVLMLPRLYRSQEQLQMLLDITNRYNQFLNYADQSAISIWLHLNALPLSTKFQFNFQTAMLDAADLRDFNLENISILHFSSQRKPNTVEFMTWDRLSLARRKEVAKLFLHYSRRDQFSHA